MNSLNHWFICAAKLTPFNTILDKRWPERCWGLRFPLGIKHTAHTKLDLPTVTFNWLVILSWYFKIKWRHHQERCWFRAASWIQYSWRWLVSVADWKVAGIKRLPTGCLFTCASLVISSSSVSLKRCYKTWVLCHNPAQTSPSHLYYRVKHPRNIILNKCISSNAVSKGNGQVPSLLHCFFVNVENQSVPYFN